jgi:hypothetical protein
MGLRTYTTVPVHLFHALDKGPHDMTDIYVTCKGNQ